MPIGGLWVSGASHAPKGPCHTDLIKVIVAGISKFFVLHSQYYYFHIILYMCVWPQV